MEFLKLLNEARIKYFCDRDEGVKRPQDTTDKDISDWIALKPFALVNPDQLRTIVMAAIDYKNAWFDQRDATGNNWLAGYNQAATECREYLLEVLTVLGQVKNTPDHPELCTIPTTTRGNLIARGWALFKRGNYLNKPKTGYDLERRIKEWEGHR